MNDTEVGNRSVSAPPRDNHPPQHISCWDWFQVDWDWFQVDRDWLKEVRGHLITAAVLTATMAYQSILSPPGGLWQETKPTPSPSLGYTADDKEIAGHAIMNSNDSYRIYLVFNTIVFGASLSTIMLAMTGFPTKNKFFTWSLVIIVHITIIFMGAAYATALNLVSPDSLSMGALDVDDLLYGWLGLCILCIMVLHSIHVLVWLGKNLVKLVKACC